MNSNTKSALITGASRGIGKAIAAEFALRGYSLYITAFRHGDELDLLKEELSTTATAPIYTFTGDISDPDFVREVFSSINSLDILVNNAGISITGCLQDVSDSEWQRIIGVNLNSVFYTCRSAIPLFLQNSGKEVPGSIINISSVWGEKGASCEVAYSATKGAVNTFTKALAKELAPSHIPVNAIACGFIDTDMNGHLSEEEKKAVIEEIPFGRMGTPEEIAISAASIAEMPAYMTGQIITVDGGWT